jgi:2OG-Fe(II) oxygenase superfamily
MNLADWIRAPLLAPSAVEASAASLRSDGMGTVLLDDFLKPDRLRALHGVFTDDAAFTEKFQVRRPDGHFDVVAEDEWQSLDEDARVERQLLLAGMPSMARMSVGVAQHVRFMGLARHPVFASFLGQIGGRDGLVFESGEARIMRSRHMVKPHTDGRRGLCAVLYVHPHWDPRCGGRLAQFERDTVRRRVDPIPNRLVIFLPGAGRRHAVEPIVEVDGWQRCSYSLWFETAAK